MKSVSSETRKPYSGATRSLVIAIDVGTTFSGVSYAILEPGEIPKIHGVTRFPGQEHVAGNTKIPSIIYYDRHGKMVVAGAEADNASIQSQAEDEYWIKTDLFKLRLRPRTMQLNMNGMRLGPLPRKKTAVHVFGDFLAYMYRCTRNFIIDTHGNGAALWNAVENDIQFVLSHPNGWEGAQQTKMRQAAVYGGLIPDTDEGRARIRFVTEGEASLHACVLSGLATDVLQNPSKHGFLIADAGGGTLDISAYAIRASAPLVMEEIAPPDCVFAGSIFVSRRARGFLGEKLKDSKYGTPDTLDHITARFDETTKRLFRDRKELQFIPFGSPLDKDQAAGIRSGQLKLTGEEVADLFEPSVQAAVDAIKAQIEASNGLIHSVFLVGGYAASPWLFGQLQERLAPLKVTVSRPDMQTSKAVADGAIGFYCDHHVSARMSKFMYGVEFLRQLNPKDPEHLARKERLCELPSGPKLLPDAFDCILSRGVRVKESTVFTRKYCTELTSLSMLSVFEVEIWCYRGGNVVPQWIDRHSDTFSTLCVVRADLSPLSGSAEPKAGKNGKTYWTIVFSIEIHFGLTEFRARIKWVDNGKTRYGPASIVYNERGIRAEEEEYDTYPEDDLQSAAPSPRRDHLRSEPVSRARTPVAEHFQPTGSLDRGFDSFGSPHPAEPVVQEPVPEPVVEVQPPPPIEPPREPTPPPVEAPTPRTPATKKGKKTKTPASKAKSIVETPAPVEPSVVPEKSPAIERGASALWDSTGNDAGASADLLSPITPSATKPPTAFNSAAPTPKDLGKELDNAFTAKGSPSLEAKRSPLATSEPITVADVTVEPAALSKEIVEATPAEPPTPVAEEEPVVTPVTPSASGKKGKKKKAALAATAAAPEPAKEVEPEPVKQPDPIPEVVVATEGKPEHEESGAPPKSPAASTTAKDTGHYFFSDWGVGSKHADIGADPEKNDAWPTSEKKDGDPWGGDAWGLGDESKDDKDKDKDADLGELNTFGSTAKTPTTKASPWGAPKTPISTSEAPASPWGASKSPSTEQPKSATSAWGASKSPSTETSKPAWGAQPSTTETAKPAGAAWGAKSPSAGTPKSTPVWGAKAEPAKASAASPWGSKAKSEAPSVESKGSGWGAKLSSGLGGLGWGTSSWSAGPKSQKDEQEQKKTHEAPLAPPDEAPAQSHPDVGTDVHLPSEPAPLADGATNPADKPPSPAKVAVELPAAEASATDHEASKADGHVEEPEKKDEEKQAENEEKKDEKKDEKKAEEQKEEAAEPAAPVVAAAEDDDDWGPSGGKKKKKKKKGGK